MHDPQHPPGFPPKAFYSLLALHSPYPRAVTSRPLLSRTDDIGTNTIGAPSALSITRCLNSIANGVVFIQVFSTQLFGHCFLLAE